MRKEGREEITVPRDLPDDPTASFKPSGEKDWLTGHAGRDEDVTVESSSDVSSRSMGSTRPAEGEEREESRRGILSNREGGFRLVRIIAEGGAGEIWEAEQNNLRRIVAIKKIRESRLANVKDNLRATQYLIEQFEQEALTAAHLDHPNILPVHELTSDNAGYPLLAMKRVRGTPWPVLMDHDIREMNFEDYLRTHIPVLLDVAQAVAFAHSRGVVHRDIKPSQVMVGEYGEVLLMDWGLAILYDADALEDIENSSLRFISPVPAIASSPAGTPVYMAPEQTEPSASNVGPWTDVYLLGGTLYYLLMGMPPHGKGDKEEIFRRAADGFVVPLDEAAGGKEIPGELRQLVEDSLEPGRLRRLQTAKEFVERLEDYLSGAGKREESERLIKEVASSLDKTQREYRDYAEALGLLINAGTLWPNNPQVWPLRNRVLYDYALKAIQNGDLTMARTRAEELPESDLRHHILREVEVKEREIARRESQRRLAMVAASILFLVAVVVALVAVNQARLATEANRETNIALEDARVQREEAVRMGHVAEREQYFAAVGYANSTLRDYNTRQIDRLLSDASAEHRHWEWYFVNHEINQNTDRFDAPFQLLSVRYSPQNHWIAMGGESKEGLLWSPESGETITLTGHEDKIYYFDFTHDGKRVATASKDNTARVWDCVTGRMIRVLEGHEGFVHMVDFGPNDNRIVTASSDGTARIWSLDGKANVVMRGHEKPVISAMFNRAGDLVLTGSSDRTFRIWDAATGELMETVLTGHEDGISSACWSPDESQILTTSWDSTARLFDAVSLEETNVLRAHKEMIYRGSFSPDGEYVATPSIDGTVGIWDAKDGELLYRVIGHEASIWSADFNSDGSALATASYDRTARIWDLHELDPRLYRVDKIPDGETANQIQIFYTTDVSLAVVEEEWRSKSGRINIRVGNDYFTVTHGSAIFSPDGVYRLNLGGPGTVLNTETGKVAKSLPIREVYTAGFSPDGKYLVAGATQTSIWRVSDWEKMVDFPDAPYGHLVSFSEDSRFVAFNSLNHITQVWNLETMEQVSILDGGEPMGIFALEFSPDGTELATGHSPSYTIKLWDVKTGALKKELVGHTFRIWDLDYTPDGKRLASAAWDDTVRLWEPETGREIMILPRKFAGTLLGVEFSEDGRLLYAPTTYGQMEVWSAGPEMDFGVSEADRDPASTVQ